jgi:hypothetical protein
MPTTTATPEPPTRLNRLLGIGFLTLTTLVAVSVAVAFLVLLGARTGTGQREQAPGQAPLIELRTTVARPTAPSIQTNPGDHRASASDRLEDSYRAIP